MFLKYLMILLFEAGVFFVILCVSSPLIDYIAKYKKRRVLIRNGFLKMFINYKYVISKDIKPLSDYDSRKKNIQVPNIISISTIFYQVTINLLFFICAVAVILKMFSNQEIITSLYMFSIIFSFILLFVGGLTIIIIILSLNLILK